MGRLGLGRTLGGVMNKMNPEFTYRSEEQQGTNFIGNRMVCSEGERR
jgi:hypothetical protein